MGCRRVYCPNQQGNIHEYGAHLHESGTNAVIIRPVLAIAIFAGTFFGSLTQSAGRRQQVPVKTLLEILIDHFDLSNGTILDGIYKLSEERLRVNFGFEEILKNKLADTELTYPRITVKLDNKSVQEILDALCHADTRYSWSADGGTINVYPRATESDRTYLLNRRLSRFQLQNVTDITEALLAIAQQLPPPFEQVAHAQIGGDTTYPSKPWTASFDNLTFRQATNRIVEHLGIPSAWLFGGSRDFRKFSFYKGGLRR